MLFYWGGEGGEVSIEVEEIIENLFKICSYYKNSSYNKKKYMFS